MRDYNKKFSSYGYPETSEIRQMRESFDSWFKSVTGESVKEFLNRVRK